MSDRLVDLELKKIHLTDDAYLLWDGVSFKGFRRDSKWVPKKHCEEYNYNINTKIGTYTIPEWLAIKKGLV